MSLFIDTSTTTPFRMEGVVFQLRTLTTRQRLRAAIAAQEVGRIIEAMTDGEEMRAPTAEEAEAIYDAQHAILLLGIAGWTDGTVTVEEPTAEQIDAVEVRAWTPLCDAIMEANRVDEAEAKN